MRYKPLTILLSALLVVLFAFNASLAFAHRWGNWHWNKSNIGYRVFGSHTSESQAAVNDWNSCSTITLNKKNSHTDISVFGGNYGSTGWWGLAEIKNTEWDWNNWWYTGIKHGHARYNSHYGGSGGTGSNSDIRGVQCQEVGHLFGLGHSNNGCMGKGYYNSSNTVQTSHSCSDIGNYTH